jgi:hypothetical protein
MYGGDEGCLAPGAGGAPGAWRGRTMVAQDEVAADGEPAVDLLHGHAQHGPRLHARAHLAVQREPIRGHRQHRVPRTAGCTAGSRRVR